VALRSSRTRTAVTSRIGLTIGSSASERVFRRSQSVFTLRQVRLTVSLFTAPPNSAVNAGEPAACWAGQIGGGDHRVRRDECGAGRPSVPALVVPPSEVQSGARHGHLDRPNVPRRVRERWP